MIGATVVCPHSVVPSLVFVVDPVEGFHGAILNAVLGNPFIGVTAALGEDSWHDPYLLQVNLEPLVLVVKLGEPRAPAPHISTLIHCGIFTGGGAQRTRSLGCWGGPFRASRRNTIRHTGPGWSSWSGLPSQIQPRSPELCDRDTLRRTRRRMVILSSHQSKTLLGMSAALSSIMLLGEGP